MAQETTTSIDAFIEARKILNELYKTSKGKKFIHHLIYAFTKSPARYIYYSSKDMVDCITMLPIHSISTRQDPIKDSDLNNEFKELRSKEGEEYTAALDQFQANLESYLIKNPMRRVARRSDLSNKLLGNEEYLALKEFSEKQANSGNKIIGKMINYKVKRSRGSSNSSLASHVDQDTLNKLRSICQ